MKKIVQMLPALGWGGAQVFCIQLCNELAGYPGYEVTLVSLYDHNPQHMPVSLLDKRVRFVQLGKKKGFDLKIFSRVNDLLNEIKPDVVHTHLHSGYYATWSYLRLRFPVRKIHTFHSLVTKDAPVHGRLMYKYFFKNDIITPVSISEEVLKGALKEYGAKASVLIHNGSAPVKPTEKFDSVKKQVDQLKKDTDTRIFVNVGRIYPVKNQQLILKVFKKLEEENRNVVALIVGGYLPEEKEFYLELLKEKPGNVHFIGKVDNVGDYLMHADVFLMPSLYEGLPISLLEAMSAGAIPVCTPVGGLLDMVKPSIGYLSKDMSVEGYLEVIEAYLNSSPESKERMRKANMDIYQQEFSMKSCASKYNNLYFGETKQV